LLISFIKKRVSVSRTRKIEPKRKKKD